MPDQFVHSQRTSDPNSHPMIIVVGENPLARAVCDYLGAISVPDSLMSAHRFSGADVVVVAGYEANFAQRQRMDPQARAHRIHDRAFRTVYDAAACGVERIIVLSSAMMYGTTLHTTRQLPASRPGHLSWYDDSSPAAPPLTGFASDVALFEESFAQAVAQLPTGIARPAVTVLRAAAIVGGEVDTLVSRHFEAPRLLVIRGVERRWQLCHVEDLASAVRECVVNRVDGVVTVGAVRLENGQWVPDEQDSDVVAARAGTRVIAMSESAAFAMAQQLHRVGILPAPSSDLSFAVFPWVVFPRRLLELGWRPRYSSLECIDVLAQATKGRVGVGGRRFGGRDAAAAGAAGAAVAALATAAVWKQARAHR